MRYQEYKSIVHDSVIMVTIYYRKVYGSYDCYRATYFAVMITMDMGKL